MADLWYPGAIRTPGANAGYARGRNRMEVVKLHYTVGVNSHGIGLRGYFQFLINRDGTIYQYAPVDALCWDSGEWNDDGPGIEAEHHPNYHDEILNQAMRDAARGLVRWLHEEHGFPLTKWGEGRIPDSHEYRGFIDHADLIQTNQHHDYWPDEDWAYIAGGVVPPKEIDMKPGLAEIGGIVYVVDPSANTRCGIATLAALTAWQTAAPYYGCSPDINREGWLVDIAKQAVDLRTPPAALDVKAIAAAVAAAIPEGSDADPRAIAEAVRDKFREEPLR